MPTDLQAMANRVGQRLTERIRRRSYRTYDYPLADKPGRKCGRCGKTLRRGVAYAWTGRVFLCRRCCPITRKEAKTGRHYLTGTEGLW